MRIKDENKYNAILEASIEHFMSDGFAKASVAKIAKTANVSPATIYIYFENKEDLISKLYLNIRKKMSLCVLEGINLEGSIETAYKKMWFNYYNYCLKYHKEFDYMMQFSNSPYEKKYQTNDGMCYFSKIYEMFKIGKEKNIIKPVSDEILFAYTFYPTGQLAKRNLCCGTKLSGDEVQNACEIAWDAVKINEDKIYNSKEGNQMKTVREQLLTLFKSGEKRGKKLGLEFEHFLVDRETLRSYNYYEKDGQEEMVNKLLLKGWKVDYEEEGHILNASKNGNTLSFEPGGQVEVSLRPLEDILELQEEYLLVKAEIESVLNESQVLISLGYHPVTKIDELPLLPKERYKFMYDYLHTKGDMARNMMKGSASTQVSIDYVDENDFIKKFRVAYFLAPFIARLFDAAPIFENEIYKEKNLRVKIWDNTDISRSKMPPGIFDKRFDYNSYVEYIMASQPIFMMEEGKIVFMNEKTVDEIEKEMELTEDQVVHASSMVFPDVRLKNFIEIRMADALPSPFNFAIPALIKGVFYDQIILDKYYKKSLNLTDMDMINLNDEVKASYDFEYKCAHGSFICQSFIDELIADALMGLDNEEQKILSSFYEWIKINDSYSDYMKKLYQEDFDKFREAIITGGFDV